MKKAFTILEMLVVMILIALVMAIAIPAVRNLMYNSTNKEYDNLMKLAKEASKVYVKTNKAKISNKSGCLIIPYERLIEEELLEEEDITCEGNFTIRPREISGYDYEYFLTCKDSKGNIVPRNGTTKTLPSDCQYLN